MRLEPIVTKLPRPVQLDIAFVKPTLYTMELCVQDVYCLSFFPFFCLNMAFK